MLNTVLLPQPDGPTIETNSRSSATRSTPSSATTGPGRAGKLFAMPRSSRANCATVECPVQVPPLRPRVGRALDTQLGPDESGTTQGSRTQQRTAAQLRNRPVGEVLSGSRRNDQSRSADHDSATPASL